MGQISNARELAKKGSGYSRSLRIPFENDLKGPGPQRGRLLATFQEVRLGPLPSFSISAGLVSNRSAVWKLRSALDSGPHSPSGENWICWWTMSLCHNQRSRRRWVGRLCPRAQAIEIRNGKCLCKVKERNNISPAFDALADPPKRAGSDLESGGEYAEGISIYPLVPTGTSGFPDSSSLIPKRRAPERCS